MKKQLLYCLVLTFSFYLGFSKPYKKTEVLFCAAPTSLTSTNVTFTAATLNWIENGTATTWEILPLPAGSPAPLPSAVGWANATTHPFTITGLAPNTSYDVYVRSHCDAGELSNWSGPTSFTTQIAPPVCGGNFVDQGGPSGNYPNNSNYTVTICPTNPGDRVTVTFVSFNTQAGVDILRVYNGTSAIAPQIGNGYSGTANPGSFSSTDPSGCLTFVFTSNGTTTAAGWVANVSCDPIVCTPPEHLITMSEPLATSVVLLWANPLNLSSEVLILPYGSPAPTGPGVAVNSSGFVANGLTPGQCYTAYVRALCSASFHSEWSTLDFCTYNCENNAECPESLNLIAFLDENNNGVKDTGEVFFNRGSFAYQINSGNTIHGYANSGGFSIFENNPANTYNLSFDINTEYAPYYSSSTTFSNITVPAGSGSTTYYFPITQLQTFNDLAVQLIPYNNPRPGFMYSNTIVYTNNGVQNVTAGSITFTKHPSLSIVSISGSGAVTTPTGFTYNFTNLAPNEIRSITVTFLVPEIPTVNLNDILTNSVIIEPIIVDAIPANNVAALTQLVVGSYDPNDKMESHGGKIAYSTFTANDYLYYTIQFENTGTAGAEFIRVEDVLDAQLDENSFEMLNASHTVNTKREGNELTWHFYNINLPPTATNPTESHGYIQFRIKPKAGYAIGDIIPNFASIYFDFNPPIVTDTFRTEFVAALGNPDFNTNAVSLYPNPANDVITISNNNADKISKVVIYDLTGKRIFALNDNLHDTITIDVSHFAKGMYLIELLSEDNSKITKKLLLK